MKRFPALLSSFMTCLVAIGCLGRSVMVVAAQSRRQGRPRVPTRRHRRRAAMEPSLRPSFPSCVIPDA